MQFIFRSVRRSMAILLLTGLFASAGDMRTWTAQLVAPSMVNAVQPIFLASAPAADLPPPLEFKQPAIVIPRAVKVFGFTFMAQAPEKFTPRLADGTLTTELANGQGFRINGDAVRRAGGRPRTGLLSCGGGAVEG